MKRPLTSRDSSVPALAGRTLAAGLGVIAIAIAAAAAGRTAAAQTTVEIVDEIDLASYHVFIAFDREEQGLIGSSAYVAERLHHNINGMNWVELHGRTASSPLMSALGQAIILYGDGLGQSVLGPMDASDHAPFEWAGFQACLLIEEWGNPYYHTQLDHVQMPDYLDHEFAIRVCRSVAGWLADAAVVVRGPPCPADLDGTGDVGFADLLAVLGAWGPCAGCGEDLDGSGDVAFADVLAVLTAWGSC